jgi:Ca2+-binding EF-hand superfamily protein
MGEPFFGSAAGEDGLTAWFREADRNHDGVITAEEMTVDAQRFFEGLDTNHDGEIDPDEIAHYENVIAPEVRRGPPVGLEASAAGAGPGGHGAGGHGGWHGGRGRHGGGGFGGGFGGDDEASAGRFGLLQIPEPVSSADADFNRGVSSDEFRRAAIQRFQLLDADHKGRLTLSELEGIREAASSASRRPPRPKPGADDGEEGEQPPPM